MDYSIEQFVNGPAGSHPVLDALMRDIATWSVAAFIAIVAGWFLVGWIRGLAAERRGALTALLAAGGALLVNQFVLLLWQRPRPFDAHPHTVTTLVSRTTDPSFPSDHAAAAAAIAVVLLLAHRRIGAAVLGLALLVCVARVYVGAHYPGDVLAGAAVGAGVACLLWWPLARPVARLSAGVDHLIGWLHLPLPRNDESPLGERAL
jgi:membrane-associated phospholipid phosphatase